MLAVVALVIALSTSLVGAIECANYGEPNGDTCYCPPGFNPTGTNGSCSLPVCGGSLYTAVSAAPGGTSGFGNVSAGSCGCAAGWNGPGCTGESRLSE